MDKDFIVEETKTNNQIAHTSKKLQEAWKVIRKARKDYIGTRPARGSMIDALNEVIDFFENNADATEAAVACN